jgi:hypothetical protein
MSVGLVAMRIILSSNSLEQFEGLDLELVLEGAGVAAKVATVLTRRRSSDLS